MNRQEVQLSESRQLSSEFLEQQRRLRDAEDELQAAHKTNKDLQVLTHIHTYIQTNKLFLLAASACAGSTLGGGERSCGARLRGAQVEADCRGGGPAGQVDKHQGPRERQRHPDPVGPRPRTQESAG